MGPFGMPWGIAGIYIAGFIGVPLVAEIFLRTKWWKKHLDHFYAFNKEKK